MNTTIIAESCIAFYQIFFKLISGKKMSIIPSFVCACIYFFSIRCGLNSMVALDPSFTRAQLKVLWDAIDPHRQGVVEVTELHNLLAEKFGKDKTSAKGAGVVERVIKKILERCGQQAGIKGLQRYLLHN